MTRKAEDLSGKVKDAHELTFRINFGIIKIETKDNIQGMAIMLVMFFLVIIFTVILIGVFSESSISWLEQSLLWFKLCLISSVVIAFVRALFL